MTIGSEGQNVSNRNITAHFYKERADVERMRNNIRSAIQNYKKAILKNKNYLSALIALGDLLREVGSLDDSMIYLNKAYEIAPNNQEAISGLVKLFLAQNKIKEAEKYVNKGIKIDPYHTELNYLKAMIYSQRGMFYLAKNKLNAVLNLDPGYYKALIGLGNIQAKEKKYVKAYQYLRQAQSIEPEKPDVFLEMAKTKLRQITDQKESLLFDEPLDIGLFQDAISYLQNGNSYTPDHIQTNLLMGKIYSLLNKCQQASTHLSNVLNIHDEHFEALYYKGFCDPKASLSVYPKILSNRKNDEITTFHLQKNLLEQIPRRENPRIMEHVKDHFQQSKQFGALSEQGKSLYELRWAVYLFPRYLKAHVEFLNHYRINADFVRLQKTLDILRRFTGNAKYQDMYEQFIQRRRGKLYYREGIHSPIDVKSSTPLFVFYFRPTNPYGAYPDAGRAVAEKLSFALSHKGRIYILPKNKLDSIYSLLIQQNYFGLGGYYNSSLSSMVKQKADEFLSQRSEEYPQQYLFKKKELRYIIDGSYSELPQGLKVDIRLIDLHSGLSIYETSASSQGKGYITNIVVYLTNQIYNAIPFEGKIIKVKSNGVLVNLGIRDGIEKNKALYVMKNGRITKELTIHTLDTDIAWAKFKDSSDYYDLKIGDTIIDSL